MHFHRVCECFDCLTAINEGVADLWSCENVVAGIGMFEPYNESQMYEFALIYILKERKTFMLK